MLRWTRAIAALLMPLALSACLFLPGKFTSDLTIRADRSFSFAYRGEVHAIDLESSMGGMMKGFGDALQEGGAGAAESPDSEPSAEDSEPSAEDKARERAEKDEKFRALAIEIAKEAGYRSVEYRGDDIFVIDYAMSGQLTHNFVYPFNQDAAMIFPWLAIELRGKDQLRVMAAGFSKEATSSGMNSEPSKAEGVFTLTTDAEIVSQNNETGAETAGRDKVIRWKITPTTQEPPMAVLRVAGL